ncbi:hypothetical protein [Paenibacillus sedimenti]|uniref:Uncharacterized protein n=1 Tax=Paenibacillus sedimenti TaxID=2770274 RepID=A0A926KTB6_9BACL|nr:hypothetical protein [Paenibacillus sedimenti]MBD0383640.1 hypothetical protein [Paenibacillus sedimenti]
MFSILEADRGYTLFMPALTLEIGQSEVKLNEVGFDKSHVPEHVKEAALSKLRVVADYLEQHSRSLASTEDEMVALGKQMKHMKIGSELLNEGLVPDPI